MIRKAFIILILNAFLPAIGFAQGDTSIYRVIPHLASDSGWSMTGQQIYLGDDLFYLINGGAEFYFEYGFEEVAALEYADNDNVTLYIEIYEMKDPLAAFGIYSLFSSRFDTASEESQLAIEGQHLFFCKDRYFVMIRKDPEENNAGLLRMAGIISNTIPQQNALPSWLSEKIVSAGNFEDFYVIRGIIGLNNHYYFGQEDVLQFDAGLVSKHPEKQIISLYYLQEDKIEQAIGQFKNFLGSSGKFDQSAEAENVFYDKKGHLLQFEQNGNFLELSISKTQP
ncbi:MAG: DUF6599 family protein [Bacteroidota bacterium]|nr:DUF6599 family protein [Bacteroidota bacterium]